MRTLVLVFSLCMFFSIESQATAEELLLDDYQYGGKFSPAEWANSFSDSKGNVNSSQDTGNFATVKWATKWSGIPSTGESTDVAKFKTYQVDVMVEKGQPVEEEANFYLQLLVEVNQGYAYWEVFVPQKLIPADGKWYRIQVPIKSMVAGHGDGADAPTDFKTVNGCCCGMTFDDEGDDKFKFKTAHFDNVTLLTDAVEKTSIKASPKTVNPPKKR